MKRTLMSGLLAVAISGAATLAAQDQQNPPAQRPDTPKPSAPAPGAQAPSTQPPAASSAGKVTLTGCLEKGDSATEFILANAAMGSAKPDSPAGGAAGATGTAGSKGAKYTLLGKSDELTKHQGHRVEVTGTIAGGAGATSAPSGGAGAGAAGAQAAQRLQVDSVRMIAAECK
jgi:hypothetical protein